MVYNVKKKKFVVIEFLTTTGIILILGQKTIIAVVLSVFIGSITKA